MMRCMQCRVYDLRIPHFVGSESSEGLAYPARIWKAIVATKAMKQDNIPSKIEEGLYLGSVGAANNKIALKSLNVTHILTVANSLSPAYPQDFVYKVINISDREDVKISEYFDECFDFIEEAKRVGGVLVHCFVGKSRSVTIVIAYLMRKRGMTFSEAFEFVKSRRPVAGPNAGFVLQLQNYEKTIKGTKTAQEALQPSELST
ncbi:hypothetical protein Leryth_002303 [Lithospermum erythrorhizon]|nr:hypothetical protein Leryth_002303 [Lithospermum erythrorhizon]